jgi:hypothetical protein
MTRTCFSSSERHRLTGNTLSDRVPHLVLRDAARREISFEKARSQLEQPINRTQVPSSAETVVPQASRVHHEGSEGTETL